MKRTAVRIALIAGGALLLLANNGQADADFLGFYVPNTAERIGFDFSKLAIAALAIWFIARGARGRHVASPKSSWPWAP